MRHKYGAKRTTVDGITFPSKLEASVYEILKLREKLGEIKDLKLQSTVTVKEKCSHCGDGPVRWKVDFSFIDMQSDELCYAEAKGVETADFKKRKRLWKQNPKGRLEIWKGSHRYPKLVEVLE